LNIEKKNSLKNSFKSKLAIIKEFGAPLDIVGKLLVSKI
jgi:hypothetical protein